MTEAKKKELDIEAIQRALLQNPEILQAALKQQGVKGTGLPAYQLIGKEDKEIPLTKLVGTKLVPSEPKVVTFYRFRMLNGSEVSIPQHCLADYKINLNDIPSVDDDGLTNKDKSQILNNGAF